VVTPPLGVRPPLPGATLDITPSAIRLHAGESVTISGQLLTATGTPVVDREVALVDHFPGQPGWKRFEALPTTITGDVSFTVPDLVRNARFALRAGGRVHSTIVHVAVMPTITPSVAQAEDGARTTTVTVTVVGAQTGDVVVLNRYGTHRITRIAELGATGQATFTIPVPLQRTVHYRLFVRRTAAHTAAGAWFVISPAERATS
jgi:hypothetical protein